MGMTLHTGFGKRIDEHEREIPAARQLDFSLACFRRFVGIGNDAITHPRD